MTCSCIMNKAYPILGSVSVFNMKITFFGLVGSNIMYVRNTNKVIFKTCWREVMQKQMTRFEAKKSDIISRSVIC